MSIISVKPIPLLSDALSPSTPVPFLDLTSLPKRDLRLYTAPQIDLREGTDNDDEVVVLTARGTDERYYPGKVYVHGNDGRVVTRAEEDGGYTLYWSAMRVLVDSIGSLHQAMSLVASGELGWSIAVRGGLRETVNPARVTRSSQYTPARDGQPARPAGLQAAKRQWLVLDMDKVPNLASLDPRTQSDEAIRYVLSMLPMQFHEATCSYQWSSSSCVGLQEGEVPRQLSCHIRFWLNEGLDGAEAERLLKRVRQAYHAAFADRAPGHVFEKAMCAPDAALCRPTQPAYLLPPLMPAGVCDPFVAAGACRWGMVQGERDNVNVDSLRVALPELETATKGARRSSSSRTRKPRQAMPKAIVPELDITLAVSRKILADRDSARIKSGAPASPTNDLAEAFSHERRGFNRWAHHALADLGTLVDLSKANSKPGWEHGIPEGQRTQLMFRVAALCAWAYEPLTVADRVRSWARGRVSSHWLTQEWDRSKKVAGIVRRAHNDEAAHAARKAQDEVISNTRYRVSLAGLIADFDISIDEQLRLRVLQIPALQRRLKLERQAQELGVPVPARKTTRGLKKSNPLTPTPEELLSLGMSKASFYRKPEDERLALLSELRGIPVNKKDQQAVKVYEWEGVRVSQATYYKRRRLAEMNQAAVAKRAEPASDRIAGRQMAREVMDVLALAVEQKPDTLEKVAFRPYAGVAPTAYNAVLSSAERRGCDYEDLVMWFARSFETTSSFWEQFITLGYAIENGANSPATLVHHILDDMGVGAWLDGQDGGQEARAYLDSLVVVARAYPDLSEFRQVMSGNPDLDQVDIKAVEAQALELEAEEAERQRHWEERAARRIQRPSVW